MKYILFIYVVLASCFVSLQSYATDQQVESVAITDIKAWNHPTKKVFEKHKILLKKVELHEKGKYPVFSVALPYDPQTSSNEKYYNKIYLELLKANGWWDFALDDEDDGIIIKIRWDKKLKTMSTTFINKK